MRDFTKLLKNKFKSKKYFKKHSRLGYLPVGQASTTGSLSNGLELGLGSSFGLGGIPGSSTGESPSLSPQRSGSKQDVSERLADRLAELDTRSTSDESSSTRITPQQHSEPKKSTNGIFA